VVIENTETPEIMSHNLTFQVLLKIKKMHQWMATITASNDRNHWHEFAVQRWHSYWSM